jgi:hypothetical protein
VDLSLWRLHEEVENVGARSAQAKDSDSQRLNSPWLKSTFGATQVWGQNV